MNDVMLSIYITTYNQEKYISQALDSILMQKTKYPYEVLIGEDCSTDSTRKVLEEYEKKCPDNFKFYYRKKNMHNCEINNGVDLMMKCKGKYIIALEGDDYWIDESKIDTQIRFLEDNPDYIAVAHNCVVVGDDSLPNGEVYPECKDEKYSLNHYLNGILPGQLATVMYRNIYRDQSVDLSFLKSRNPLDRKLYFVLSNNGNIYCLQKTMSAYRHIVTGGYSFSANYKYNFSSSEMWNKNLLEYAYRCFKKQYIFAAEILYVRAVKNGVSSRQCNVWKAIKLLNKNLKCFPLTLFRMSLRKLKIIR